MLRYRLTKVLSHDSGTYAGFETRFSKLALRGTCAYVRQLLSNSPSCHSLPGMMASILDLFLTCCAGIYLH